MISASPAAAARRPSTHVCGELSLRLLALTLEANGDESYQVSFSPSAGAAFRSGRMTHATGASWDLSETDSAGKIHLVLGCPDAVFRLALGDSDVAERAFAAKVTEAAPQWPNSVTERLAQRRLSGAGTIAFDAQWFLAELAVSALDRPIVFPNAASKLGLAEWERACLIIEAFAHASARVAHGDTQDRALAELLLRACNAERRSTSQRDKTRTLEWAGDGRLIGEFMSGELAQLGTAIDDGCRAAIGSGLLRVVFDPAEPLGISLGPLRAADASDGDDDNGGGHDDHDSRSIGMGAEVGEVEPGGAADRAGVRAGMLLSRLSEPDVIVSSDPHSDAYSAPYSGVPFETILNDIDERRAAGHALAITFDSAAPVSHLYAVEMPAAAALTAFAVARGGLAAREDLDVDLGAALATRCGGALLWREDTPRLFLGAAGSLSCAHTDICPQLELAQGLFGLKILGIASHAATPRLSVEHAGDECADDDDNIDREATRVPTDRPLSLRQSRLLTDADVTLAVLQQGDLAVFDSGALHFASNGAGSLNAALYQGVITPAAIVRLRLAAAKASGSHAQLDGAYRNHLFASDLLREVEPLLAKFNSAAERNARQRK